MALNNNTMVNELIAATKQAIGDAEVDVVDLSDIIDVANDPNIALEKDQWTKALSVVHIKNMYSDLKYGGKVSAKYFMDSEKFGAITRVISVDLPEAKANPAWDNFVSGTSQIGVNTIYLPVVSEQLFGKTDSWSLPIAYTDDQLNSAFENESKLVEFYSYISLAVENAITLHREEMAVLNRNNFIAEKHNYAVSDEAEGVHEVNLIKEYVDTFGITTGMTVASARKDPTFLRWACARLGWYKDAMMDMSVLYNTLGKPKLVTEDRFVMETLSLFDTDCQAASYNLPTVSDIKLGIPHISNTSWQGLKSETGTNDFDTLSTISVETASDGTETTISGIVAFMCDKWALMHTIKSQRVGVQRDDIKAITLHSHQFVDSYMNNLTLPAIVFTMADVTAGVVGA